ncbi:MAG: PASTA domain-containing protein [Paludibacteraceae bacterium]
MILVFAISGIVLVSLGRFTHHGETIIVPDLHGFYPEEAEVVLKQNGLTYEIVDSIYVRDKLPGEIIEQVPAANTPVKLGRKIYLTINSSSKKQIVLPDLRNFPARQAKATLEAMGFRIEKIDYKPSEYPDLVMEIKVNDCAIAPGSKITDGASLTLVVGERTIGETAYTPDLKGLDIATAETTVANYRFVLGAVEYDETPVNEADKSSFFVYRQTPAAGSAYETGRRIDIWLTTNQNKLSQRQEQNDTPLEEDFFN